jgi:hypothetical protein
MINVSRPTIEKIEAATDLTFVQSEDTGNGYVLSFESPHEENKVEFFEEEWNSEVEFLNHVMAHYAKGMHLGRRGHSVSTLTLTIRVEGIDPHGHAVDFPVEIPVRQHHIVADTNVLDLDHVNTQTDAMGYEFGTSLKAQLSALANSIEEIAHANA